MTPQEVMRKQAKRRPIPQLIFEGRRPTPLPLPVREASIYLCRLFGIKIILYIMYLWIKEVTIAMVLTPLS
jgi:hypothetical protein